MAVRFDVCRLDGCAGLCPKNPTSGLSSYSFKLGKHIHALIRGCDEVYMCQAPDQRHKYVVIHHDRSKNEPTFSNFFGFSFDKSCVHSVCQKSLASQFDTFASIVPYSVHSEFDRSSSIDRFTMKAFLPCLVASTFTSALSLNFTEVDDTVNRTAAPSPAPPPTDFPTPAQPFEYRPWGESSFGDGYQDLYYWGYQHAIRRPGWSWGEPLQGYAPFCYGNNTATDCFSVGSACTALGGTVLHDSYCSFPESVKIAGPSCWRGM